MSALLDLRAAIIAGIRAALPDLKEVDAHGGQFTADELMRFSARAPGVRIALTGLSDPRPVSGGGCDWAVDVVAIAIAEDRAGVARDAAALAIVSGILGAAYQAQWGLDFTHPAQAGSASSLYSAGLDRKGVALWAVRWRQDVRLPVGVSPGETIASELYLGISPETGPGHEDDYIRIGGEA